MMKKGMIKFLATGMTALTLMGTAVALAPATQVYAAEIDTMENASESTSEIKTMSVREANAYVKELVGYTVPSQVYDNTRVYQVGNKVYFISFIEQEPEIIDKYFEDDAEAEEFYLECLNKGIIENELKEYYTTTIDGNWAFEYAVVVGKIPTVQVVIDIYTV